MSDIVERLREACEWPVYAAKIHPDMDCETALAAADEIERLRADVADYKMRLQKKDQKLAMAELALDAHRLGLD